MPQCDSHTSASLFCRSTVGPLSLTAEGRAWQHHGWGGGRTRLLLGFRLEFLNQFFDRIGHLVGRVLAQGAADRVVLVGFKGVCERGGVVEGVVETEVVEIVDDVGHEVAVEIGVLLFPGVIEVLLHFGEAEDAVPQLHEPVALVLHHMGPEATDITQYFGADGLGADVVLFQHVVDGVGPLFLFGRGLPFPTSTVMIDDSSGIGVVVPHSSDVNFLESVARSGIAFDVELLITNLNSPFIALYASDLELCCDD